METMRLRKIQHPTEVERLLESYIRRAEVLPREAHQIRAARAVPRELRSIVARAVELGKAWSCWTHGYRTWLFTAEMSLELSRERGAPVLQVSVYGDDGSLKESATLMTDPSGKWRRCAE